MKKRVLSFMLSLGIIFTNFSSGFTAIAEEAESNESKFENSSQEDVTEQEEDSGDDNADDADNDEQPPEPPVSIPEDNDNNEEDNIDNENEENNIDDENKEDNTDDNKQPPENYDTKCPEVGEYRANWGNISFKAFDDEHGSGIKKVEVVAYNDEKEKIFNIPLSEDNQYEFNFNEVSDLPFNADGKLKKLKIKIKVTDNAGNEGEYEDTLSNVDNTPPTVEYFFEYFNKKDDKFYPLDIIENVNMIKDDYMDYMIENDNGWFSNKRSLRLCLNVSDDESDIVSVKFIHNEGEGDFKKTSEDDKKNETGEKEYNYHCEFGNTSCNFENFCIEIENGAGTKVHIYAGNKEKPGKFVIDCDNPSGRIRMSSGNKTWFNEKGIEDSNINVLFEPEDKKSGISKITIKDTYNGTEMNALNIDIEDDAKLKIEYADFFRDDHSGFEKKLDLSIPLEKFKDGKHELVMTVWDNAGNKFDTQSLPINIDRKAPNAGTISLSSESQKECISIDGNNWFKGRDKVTFTLSSEESEGIEKAKYRFLDSSGNQIGSEEYVKFYEGASDSKTKKYINTVDINDSVITSEQSIKLEVTFIDQAGNESKPVIYNYYKDISSPKIDSVYVSKAESPTDKILRILSFGIFSNDKIKYDVYAYDEPGDSGLDKNAVKINFKNSEAEETMTYEGTDADGKAHYSFTVSPKEKNYSDNVSFTVTDRVGHSSSDDFVIKGTSDNFFVNKQTETASKFFMIDKTDPVLSVALESRSDDKNIWKDGENVWINDDHEIKINVSDADSGLCSVYCIVNGNEEKRLTKDSSGKEMLKENITFAFETYENTEKKVEYKIDTKDLESLYYAEDGHYTVKVVAEDYAGNISEQEIEYYIDRKIPEIKSMKFSVVSADEIDGMSEFFDKVEKLEYGYYFKTDLEVEVDISDSFRSSGISHMTYRLQERDDGNIISEGSPESVMVNGSAQYGDSNSENIGKATFNIPAGFKGQIFMNVYDHLGNALDNELTLDAFVVDTPEKHDSEQHIEISGIGDTNFKDAKEHKLYDKDVEVSVKISDKISGIREIRYAMDSEKSTHEMKSIIIENSGNVINMELGDGWIVSSMDDNLVTEVERKYIFAEDNNDIMLSFEMTDRSNNTSSDKSDVFSIDKTSPIINVSFDSPEGKGEYYSKERTAVIQVIERNFDPSKISANIQNGYGSVPSVGSFTEVSDTEHIATVKFGEGDYTFSIEGSDICDHNASVNYSGGNERKFYIDLTPPKVEHNFDQFKNDSENSFNVDKEMTITIKEHNFDSSGNNVYIYRTEAGNVMTVSNREDCTSEYISADKWVNIDDTHTISFKFSKDYIYQVYVKSYDSSGQSSEEQLSPAFEIDKVKPVLSTPKDLDVLVYTAKNTETEAKSIVFDDKNISEIKYVITSYQLKINDDAIGYDVAVNSKEFSIKGDNVKIGKEYFEHDGIYEVKCTPYDVAGNIGDETTHTFVIQRNTDFLVYIPESNKERETGLYKFDRKGIRSSDFEDIRIIAYIINDKTFGIKVDGSDVTDSGLDVTKDQQMINRVDKYDVILKNSYILQNYNGDTVETDLALNAVVNDDSTEQVITLGHIYIDNVKPVGEYEKSLQNMKFFDGFYGVSSKTVTIEGVSTDIDLNSCEIKVNDDILTYDKNGFEYDPENHKISFVINAGYNEIRPTLVDNAGNKNKLETKKNIYVGNFFSRWWYAFAVVILVVAASSASFIIMRRNKKKRR